MASITHTPARGARFSQWVIGATVVAGVVAVLPIVVALFGAVLGDSSPAVSAFASAPSGEYVVVARPESAEIDVIEVAPTSDSSAAIEIARIAHIPGYTPTGAVSPDGRRLALVVADAGPQANPTASLMVVHLESGAVQKLASGLDYLQTPVWSRTGDAVVVSRTEQPGGPSATVRLTRVSLNGGEQEALKLEGVLGLFPVGFDASDRLVSVVIDGRGSTVLVDGKEAADLGRYITRDWRLDDAGAALAYIETNTDSGVRYYARTVSLGGDGAVAQALALSAGGQQLGAAFKPGASAPTFGSEPVAPSAPEGASAQALVAGFDVPLDYSGSGSALAVQHWTGASFAQPGKAEMQIVREDGSRASLGRYTEFYGWAAR